MKLQKFLKETTKDNLKWYIAHIENIQKQISVLEGSRTTWEQNLAGELIELIKKDEAYNKVEKIINIPLYRGGNKQGTILTQICMKMAESLGKFYNTPEECSNNYINWGYEIYDVPLDEIERNIGSGERKVLEDELDMLNDFLKTYYVEVKLNNYNGFSIKLEIRIFP